MIDHITTLREMFAVCANERRMKEADALEFAIGAVEWVPVSDRLPPADLMVLVYTPGEGGGMNFDYIEEGCWGNHANSYEHFMAVGGASAGGPDCVCAGPSEDAPYTHWRHIEEPTPPPAHILEGERK